jgi:hypothetical protein
MLGNLCDLLFCHSGIVRNVYVTGPESSADAATYRTELIRPLGE